ncbi:MAG: ribonuclease H-like domain-containing protein [Firmicutes bacterium]|nr:ribonuclease H-like domain-containing protein [Bacillota bacterium]
MRIIEERIDSAFFDSPIFSEYFGGLKIVVADIETTGLSPARCAVILGGALAPDPEGGLKAIQFFGDTVDDEAELLDRYADFLSQYDIVVTYNGNKFDLPFIRKRMAQRKLDTSRLDHLYSLDLYRVLKKHSHLPELLPNMKQKTVEIFMGESDDRTDEIDGAESVELYYEYVGCCGPRKGEILDRILLHNRDDIVRLGSMLKIIRTLNLHEIMYHMGFPVAFTEMKATVEEMSFSGRKLSVAGRVDGVISDYMCFDDGFELEVKAQKHGFKLDIICDSVDGFTVVDAKALGVVTPQMRDLGGYESGYLILRDGKDVRYHEVNLLVRNLLYKVLQ